MHENVFISNPVLSLQSLLREISYYDDEISDIIPDGIFSAETTRAVSDFQRKHGLEENGIVNYTTWKKLIEENEKSQKKYAPPSKAEIYPDADFIISAYDETPHLSVIQSMINNIADRYENIPKLEINNVHDNMSVYAVEELQSIFNLEQNGIIDKTFWEYLSRLYEAVVVRIL